MPARWRWLLTLLLACGPAHALQYAASGSGTYANDIGWFDFSSYTNAQASSAAGQSFSYALADGSTLSFTIKRTGQAVFSAAKVPVLSNVAFGNNSYSGIDSGATKTALYD